MSQIEENLNVPIEENPDELVKENLDVPIEENYQKKKKIQKDDMSLLQLKFDPGLCRQIYTCHVDQQDKIRQQYIKLGPYQLHLKIF